MALMCLPLSGQTAWQAICQAFGQRECRFGSGILKSLFRRW